MACVENIPPANAESEMEEGEIVDEFDDISSDEELLLRQRLHVLETYNNVLEKKKAKAVPGHRERYELPTQDLSDISASDLDDGLHHIYKNVRQKEFKTYVKPKRRKEAPSSKASSRNKDYKKKGHRKKKLEIKIISESSEESDDEYRNKRRKLANAVSVNKEKNDTSSLSARLKKMLYGPQKLDSSKHVATENITNNTKLDNLSSVPNVAEINRVDSTMQTIGNINNTEHVSELIDLCNEDDVKIIDSTEPTQDTVDSVITEKTEEKSDKKNHGDSDDDLELLRQHALKTKSSKTKPAHLEVSNESDNKPFILPEDDDSYTAELRLICLKSAYLKKAIEIKRKQKLKKRLSQSSILQDDLMNEQDFLSNKIDSQNNTDIESVDMDIGSDDEKLKEIGSDLNKNNKANDLNLTNGSTDKLKDDELDEDEDLLRAKLLTSLSKNLPNLIDSNILDSINDARNTEKPIVEKNKLKSTAPEPKRFIIQLGESDSEGEHEATKNLTKMHMKQQQTDFEQQLDMFLKCTRMEVEKQQIPNIQDPSLKTPEKFVPKSVKHLPKSEQIEYKNLVKRMAELEKIKQARQSSVNKAPVKETLKPRNISVETKIAPNNNIDEQIAVSRKKIAEESANMIRLKEEATKLSRKYKMVATELKNISTAIALNKKQQRSAQTRLSKIRSQHQMLLKSSTFTHSQNNTFISSLNRTATKVITTTKLQKENDPTKEEYKNPNVLKSMKVSVVNDLKEETIPNTKISIQIDVANNKKIVKKSPVKDKKSDDINHLPELETVDDIKCSNSETDAEHPIVEKGGGKRRNSREHLSNPIMEKRLPCKKRDIDDYKSPLEALDTANWEEDPNAFLCPFEVGGHCKDPDCKYLHPKTPATQ